jgi:hypothetical protein
MNPAALIEEIARQANEFLDGASDRRQGRADVEEFLTIEHPELDAGARRIVVDGVMAVLEAEDFFGVEFVGDPFAEDDKDADH